jgi:amidohydrolase
MLPTLERVAGAAQVTLMPKVTGSEDFSFYQHVVPGLFFFVGVTPKARDLATAPPNHSPLFYIDEAGLPLGVRALAHAAVDWLEANPTQANR